MSDLHAALLEAITARKARAEAASPGPWIICDPNEGSGALPFWNVVNDAYLNPSGDDEPVLDVELHVGSKADADLIAAEDPAAVLRQCERDLKVLARHAAGDPKGGDDTVACAGCTHINFSAWECWSAWPCIEITDLAAAYAIPVDATAGQTPGGTNG